VEKRIFWLIFLVLDTVAGFALPMWWSLALTLPIMVVSWWIAFRSGWFE
jgi:hypothetical protein